MELLSLLYIFIDIAFASLFITLCIVRPLWCFTAILGYLAHPLVTEPVLKGVFTAVHRFRPSHRRSSLSEKPLSSIPIIYDERYNIGLFGLEERYAFDFARYRKTLALLSQSGEVKSILPSGDPDYPFIYSHVGLKHLILLNYSVYLSRISRLNLFFLPGSVLRWAALRKFLYATQGTLTAIEAALRSGFAINLGGGFHNAHANGGSDFCFYNDIGMAIAYLQSRKPNPISRVMVVDLDAHQGNGHERDKMLLRDHSSVFIVDFFNPDVFPGDLEAARLIDRKVTLSPQTGDAEYLQAVSRSVDEALSSFKPQFVIYSAGVDLLAGNVAGRLNVSPQAVIARDLIVMKKVMAKKTPAVMLLSRGFNKQNAKVVADSIISLDEQFVRSLDTESQSSGAYLTASEGERSTASSLILHKI